MLVARVEQDERGAAIDDRSRASFSSFRCQAEFDGCNLRELPQENLE
jgi:hypothetical protein